MLCLRLKVFGEVKPNHKEGIVKIILTETVDLEIIKEKIEDLGFSAS